MLGEFNTYISSVDSIVKPMANAWSFPSAIIATTVPLSTGVMQAPGDVKPGHIIFAPLNTKRIAPLSTCSIGKKYGYLCKSRRVGIHWPSRCRKNSWSPALFISISICSWHFTILNASFFGNIWSMWVSMCGNWSNNLVRMPFCTDDFNCWVPEMFSFSSNLFGTQFQNDLLQFWMRIVNRIDKNVIPCVILTFWTFSLEICCEWRKLVVVFAKELLVLVLCSFDVCILLTCQKTTALIYYMRHCQWKWGYV